MNNLLYRLGTWYFNRRVPVSVREYDNRNFIRLSLQTDSKKQAEKLAAEHNAKLEEYWQSLLATGKKHSHENYRQVMQRSTLFGFAYQPVEQLAVGPVEELLSRLSYTSPTAMQRKARGSGVGRLRAACD